MVALTKILASRLRSRIDPESPSCFSIKTAAAGIGFSSAVASRRSTVPRGSP